MDYKETLSIMLVLVFIGFIHQGSHDVLWPHLASHPKKSTNYNSLSWSAIPSAKYTKSYSKWP